jgi:hypothetical protein
MKYATKQQLNNGWMVHFGDFARMKLHSELARKISALATALIAPTAESIICICEIVRATNSAHYKGFPAAARN